MNDFIVNCKNIVKIFPGMAEDLEILKDINLEIKHGSVVSITGASGCGKSTLLSILGGLDTPSGGSAFVDNLPLHSTSEKDLNEFRLFSIGFVFQFHYLLKDFTAIENVAMPAIIAGMSRKKAEEKASELLLEFDLENRAKFYPAKLSGGERQRFAIARALMNDPKIILADEPTGNLDEHTAKMVEEVLFQAVTNHGKTLILVTHDTRLATKADLRFRLHEGELFQQ